jgi:hypothetical protein
MEVPKNGQFFMRNESNQNQIVVGTRVAKILKILQQAMFDNSLQVPLLNDLMYILFIALEGALPPKAPGQAAQPASTDSASLISLSLLAPNKSTTGHLSPGAAGHLSSFFFRKESSLSS